MGVPFFSSHVCVWLHDFLGRWDFANDQAFGSMTRHIVGSREMIDGYA